MYFSYFSPGGGGIKLAAAFELGIYYGCDIMAFKAAALTSNGLECQIRPQIRPLHYWSHVELERLQITANWPDSFLSLGVVLSDGTVRQGFFISLECLLRTSRHRQSWSRVSPVSAATQR